MKKSSGEGSGFELYTKALEEEKRESPEPAVVVQLLRESEKRGCHEAIYALATFYLHGKYLEINLHEAVDRLIAASRRGNSDAAYDLAVCYETGSGVAENKTLAFKEYTRAALLGDKQSIYEVGRCYHYGIGVCADLDIAKVWLDMASYYSIFEKE